MLWSRFRSIGLRVPSGGASPRCPVSLSGTLMPKVLLRGRWQPPSYNQDAVATAPAPLACSASALCIRAAKGSGMRAPTQKGTERQ